MEYASVDSTLHWAQLFFLGRISTLAEHSGPALGKMPDGLKNFELLEED